MMKFRVNEILAGVVSISALSVMFLFVVNPNDIHNFLVSILAELLWIALSIGFFVAWYVATIYLTSALDSIWPPKSRG